MKLKVQAERDCESARRYSDKETKFLDIGAVHGKKRKNLQPEIQLEAEAAEKGKSCAKLPAHESKDAAIMKARVSLWNDKHRG